MLGSFEAVSHPGEEPELVLRLDQPVRRLLEQCRLHAGEVVGDAAAEFDEGGDPGPRRATALGFSRGAQ
jgi:hypothetical protein